MILDALKELGLDTTYKRHLVIHDETSMTTTIHVNLNDVNALTQWQCGTMLNARADLNYDEALFWEVCKQMNRVSDAHIWSKHFTSMTTIRDMITAIAPVVRVEFLKRYIETFERTLLI